MERAIVSARAKREYVEAIYQRYRRAKRAEKRQILDEFCHVAAYHRKSAIRLLSGPAPGAAVRPPRHRDLRCSAAAIAALRAIWEAAGYPWSRRLKALLPLWMPWARHRLRLRPAVERQVLAISPRQMDRCGIGSWGGRRLSTAIMSGGGGPRPGRPRRRRGLELAMLGAVPTRCATVT